MHYTSERIRKVKEVTSDFNPKTVKAIPVICSNISETGYAIRINNISHHRARMSPITPANGFIKLRMHNPI